MAEQLALAEFLSSEFAPQVLAERMDELVQRLAGVILGPQGRWTLKALFSTPCSIAGVRQSAR
jgi:hypothetical protein